MKTIAFHALSAALSALVQQRIQLRKIKAAETEEERNAAIAESDALLESTHASTIEELDRDIADG